MPYRYPDVTLYGEQFLFVFVAQIVSDTVLILDRACCGKLRLFCRLLPGLFGYVEDIRGCLRKYVFGLRRSALAFEIRPSAPIQDL